MPLSETRARELAELEPPRSIDRIVRFFSDLEQRVALMPSAAFSPEAARADRIGGITGMASAPAIGMAGRGAAAFAQQVQAGSEAWGAGASMQALLMRYQVGIADVQQFALWLAHWNDKRLETETIRMDDVQFKRAFQPSGRDAEQTPGDPFTGPERVYARPRRLTRTKAGDYEAYDGEPTEADGWPQQERSPQPTSRQRQRRIAATENMQARSREATEEPDVLSRAWRGGREAPPLKLRPPGSSPYQELNVPAATDTAATSEGLAEAGGKTLVGGPDPLALAQSPRSVGTVLNRAMSNTGIFTGGVILGASLAHEQGANSLLSVQTAGFAPLTRGLGGSGGYTPPGFDYALSRPPIPVVSYLGTAVAPPALPSSQGTSSLRLPFDSPASDGTQTFTAGPGSRPDQNTFRLPDASREPNVSTQRDVYGAAPQDGSGNGAERQRQNSTPSAQGDETAQSPEDARTQAKTGTQPRARRFDPAGLWGLAAGSAAIALLLSLSGRAHANPVAQAALSRFGQTSGGNVRRAVDLLLANPNVLQAGGGLEQAIGSQNARGMAAGAGLPTAGFSAAGNQTAFGMGRPATPGVLLPLQPAQIGVGRTNLLTGQPFTPSNLTGARGMGLPGQPSPNATNAALQPNGALALPGQRAATPGASPASLRPEMGQITLIAPPMNVASSQAERGGVATAFDWNTLAMGAGPLDEAGWARLKSTLPPNAQLIYPALPPGSAGVNLPLAPGLLQSLMTQGYAPGTAEMAAEASRKGAQTGAPRSSSPSLPGRIVPVGTPPGAQAGLLETPGANTAAGSLAEAGHGQAKRGGALDFLGMPVRLAPSLGGKPELAAEVAARHGGTESGTPTVVRPEQFAPLRDRLFPQYQSVAAEMDRGAWSKAAPAYGLRDSDPTTLLSPDARIARPTATSPLPQMAGGNGGSRLAPLLAQALHTGTGHGSGDAMSMSRFLAGNGPFGASLPSSTPPSSGSALTGMHGRSVPAPGFGMGASAPSLPTGGHTSAVPTGALHTSSGLPSIGGSSLPGAASSPSTPLLPGAMSFSSSGTGHIPAAFGSPAHSLGSGGKSGGASSSLPIMPAAPFAPTASAGATSLPITGRQSPTSGSSSSAPLSSGRSAGSGTSHSPAIGINMGAMPRMSPSLPSGGHTPSLTATRPVSGPMGSHSAPIMPSLPAAQGHGAPSGPTSGGFAPVSLPALPTGKPQSGSPGTRALPGSSTPSLSDHFSLPHMPTHGAQAGSPAIISMPMPVSHSAGPMPTHGASFVSSRLPDSLADRAPTLTLPPIHAGRGSSRRAGGADGLVIQRSEVGSASQSRTAEKSVQAPRASALAAGENSGKASEVHLLAHEVWALLKRRMTIESERRGRW